MLQRLLNYIKRWWETPVVGVHRKLALEGAVPEHETGVESGNGAMQDVQAVAERVGDAAGMVMPYDEHLLERAKTQWQFGDWESLSKLTIDSITHHPERAKLALLAAAGRLQTANDTDVGRLMKLAQEWGASKKLISQILISSTYNSLGRAAALGQKYQLARELFSDAVLIGSPGSYTKTLATARTLEQLGQLKLPTSVDAGGGIVSVAVTPQKSASLALDVTASANASTKPEQKVDKKDLQPKKVSSDAEIDDFLNDIAPFFRNCSMLYVDVGAFVGEVFLKIVSSKKLKLREAHLIEPNPSSYKELQEKVKSSGVQSCNTYHFGISNTPGRAKFKAAQSMTKKVNLDIAVEDTSGFFEVDCFRLDEISSVFTDRRIDLLKLDVEGEELDVLRSAGQLLAEQRINVIYIEVGLNRSGTQQTYFGDLDAFMQSHGYRVFRFYEQKHEWIDDSPLLRRCNAAYMSKVFADSKSFSDAMRAEIRRN